MTSPSKSKLRVLMIGPLPPPVGGMATVVESLTETLASDWDIRVLNTVKTTTVGRNLLQAVTAQLSLVLRLAKLCVFWRPDIVHIHTCSWFSFWRSGLDIILAKLTGRRVLLHIHGAEFHRFLSSLSPWRAMLVKGVLMASTSRIVVLGEHWRQKLEPWCDPRKIVVIPNGVKLPETPAHDEQLIFTVICLANYERRKGQADLLRAAAMLRDEFPMRVILLGAEGEPRSRRHLLQSARCAGIANRVEIPGPAVGIAKEQWWRQADVFCLPSYDEGLPMSMLEAMALELPVVVTRVGSIPEAVADGVEGFLFTPGDIEQLAQHLRTLAQQATLRRSMGKAGRDRVKTQFDLAKMAQRIAAQYSAITNKTKTLKKEISVLPKLRQT